MILRSGRARWNAMTSLGGRLKTFPACLKNTSLPGLPSLPGQKRKRQSAGICLRLGRLGRPGRLGRLSLFAFLAAAALGFSVALQVEETLLAFLQKRFQLVLERGLGAGAGDAFFRGEGLFDGEVQLPTLVQAQDLDLDLLLFLQVVPDVL